MSVMSTPPEVLRELLAELKKIGPVTIKSRLEKNDQGNYLVEAFGDQKKPFLKIKATYILTVNDNGKNVEVPFERYIFTNSASDYSPQLGEIAHKSKREAIQYTGFEVRDPEISSRLAKMDAKSVSKEIFNRSLA